MEFLKVPATQFGDFVFLATEDDRMLTVYYSRCAPRAKLTPKDTADPRFSLFQIQAVDRSAPGDVLKPGCRFHLFHPLTKKYLDCSQDSNSAAVTLAAGVPLSAAVCSSRPSVSEGLKDRDTCVLQWSDITLALAHDLWFKGATNDKWVLRRYQQHTEETSEVLYGQVYRLRANNSMFLSVLPNYSNSATLLEEQDSDHCYPEYSGPLCADLSTAQEDANNYWVFERPDSLQGGVLQSGDCFYLRHVGSGRYLSAGLSLSSRTDAQGYMLVSVDGSVGLGEVCQLASESGAVVSAVSGPGACFQRVAGDLPRGSTIRSDLTTDAVVATANLKFEVYYVDEAAANTVTWYSMLMKPLARLRALLQKRSTASSTLVEETFTSVSSEDLQIGRKEDAETAQVLSGLQLPWELLRIYLLLSHHNLSESAAERLWQALTKLQLFDSVFQSIYARKEALRKSLQTARTASSKALYLGLKTNSLSPIARQYWMKVYMACLGNSLPAGDIWYTLLLDRQAFPCLPRSFAVNECKRCIEILEGGRVRLDGEEADIPLIIKDKSKSFTANLNLLKAVCSDEGLHREVVQSTGLSAQACVDLVAVAVDDVKVLDSLYSLIATVHVPAESGRRSLSSLIGTKVVSRRQITESSEGHDLFYFCAPKSPIAQLVKEEVFFWLCTSHQSDADSVAGWYEMATSHVQFVQRLLEYDAVSELFAVATVTAVSALTRWVLSQFVPDFAERFPSIEASTYRVEVQVQLFVEGFLQLVDTFQRWKKVKVMRKLATMRLSKVTRTELRAMFETLSAQVVFESYDQESTALRPADSLLSDSGYSVLLDSLKSLINNPFVSLEKVLLHVFKATPYRCRDRPSHILTLIDNEVDVCAHFAVELNEYIDGDPFRALLALVEEIRKWTVDPLQLETTQEVQGLGELVKAMAALWNVMKDTEEETSSNLRVLLAKCDLISDIEVMWQRCLYSAFPEHPLTVRLRTLTLDITRFYISGNLTRRKQFLRVLPITAFYPDYSQYIQLLGELGLVDPAEGEALTCEVVKKIGTAQSRRVIYALEELAGRPNNRSNVAFSIVESLQQSAKEELSACEWDALLLAASLMSVGERRQWIAPIVQKRRSSPGNLLRLAVSAALSVDPEADSALVSSAVRTIADYISTVDLPTIVSLLAALEKDDSSLRNLELCSDDESFLVSMLWGRNCQLLTALEQGLPAAMKRDLEYELLKLYKQLRGKPQVQVSASQLSAHLLTFYSSSETELPPEHQELSKQVLTAESTLSPQQRESPNIPCPQSFVEVLGATQQPRPLLQRLFIYESEAPPPPKLDKDELMPEFVVRSAMMRSARVEVNHTFQNLQRWFQADAGGVDYLEACKRAVEILSPETANDEKFEEVIENLLDLAVSRGDAEVTWRVLEIVADIVKKVSGIREHFLALLKTRRYHSQVFGLLTALVNRKREVEAKLAEEVHLKEILSEDYEKAARSICAYLTLLQFCCDGCFSPFQEFLRDQGEGPQLSVNVIYVAAGLLTESLGKLGSNTDQEIAVRCSFMLLEAVTGPSVANQQVVWKYPGFVEGIVSVVWSVCNGYSEANSAREVLPGVLKLLLALLEGKEKDEAAIKEVISEGSLGEFKELAISLCGQLSEERLELMSHGLATPEDKAAFDLAVQSCLLCFSTLPEEKLSEFKSFPLTKFIASVEVEHEGSIRTISFPVPFQCQFLTSQTASQLLLSINRESRQVKLDDFTDKIAICRTEMEHQQWLCSHKALKAVTQWWRALWLASFALVVAINALLVGTVRSSDFTVEEHWATLVFVLGLAQALCSTVGTLSFYFEYSYVLRTPMEAVSESEEMEALPRKFSPGSLCTYLSVLKGGSPSGYDTHEVVVALVRVSYSLGACVALWLPFLYPVLLLQLINLNDSIVNILKSVTQRGSQLTLTFLFSTICIYLFTVIAYFIFPHYYQPDEGLYCETLFECFLSTLNLGMRSGGGIGDAFGPSAEADFGPRLIYDLLFFIAITTILMAIVFGLIVDTFSELRDERNEIESDMNNVCLICGRTRSVIELKGEGWEKHTLLVHNPFAYIYFLIRVDETHANDCSGIEKSVKEKRLEGNISFYPTTSRVLGFGLPSED